MDVIKQMIGGFGEILAKILGKKVNGNEFFLVQETLEPSDVALLINALISEGQLNEAENLLFAQFELNPCLETYKAGLDMYARLEQMDDQALEQANFSRAEVAQGLSDFQDARYGKALF